MNFQGLTSFGESSGSQQNSMLGFYHVT